MSPDRAPRPPRPRRFNLRAALVLGAALVVALPAFLALKAWQDARGRTALLREAEARVTAGQFPLALGYLNRYLELNPDDVEALDLKAKLLADHAVSDEQVLEAAAAHVPVLGRAPDDPRRQATRRRLVKLELRIQGRARAAEALARDLIRRGADDAEAHRLLAESLEALGILEGQPGHYLQARDEYLAAEAKEPGSVENAERLASLLRYRLDRPAEVNAVFDRLVAVTKDHPKAHAAALLARSRDFNVRRMPAEAQADVKLALKDDPRDLEVLLAAARMAIERHDPVAARLHLEAIDPSHRDDLRIKETEGLVDLAELRPDDAIAVWRASLRQTGGSDAELTWRLAHVLLELGRVDQAEPLISQYRRLSGGEAPNPRARYLRALSLLKRNRPAEALAEAEPVRYKADNGLQPHLKYLLGQAYESLRDQPKAVEAYREAADSSEDWSDPWLALSRLEGEARPAEAAALIGRALDRSPKDPKLLAARAQLLWREQVRKPAAARDWKPLERALADAGQKVPGSPELALVRADYLNSTGKPDDAASLLDAATRLNPRSAELWLARVNALLRNGHIAQALDTVERAVTAAGPQAGFFITRASLHVMKGQVNAARNDLLDGLAKSPPEQRPLLWKNLGDFYHARKDDASAKGAYEAWAKLQPENPDPKLALVELALASRDETEIVKAVEAVRKVGGLKAYYWRYARVQDLLRDRPGEVPDAARDARRLEEARKLADEVAANDAQLALGPLLQGRVAEKAKDVNSAVAAYETALKRNGGAEAVTRLVALLVREHREADLDRLRTTLAAMPPELERLAAVQALRLGNKGRAEQLAALAIQGDPRGVDAKVWQADVLNALGKPQEAEATLRALVAQRPTEPAPWLQLLMLQITRRDPRVGETINQIRAQVKVPFPELLVAQCYRAAGDFRKADAAYQEAITRWPSELEVLRSAVTFYEQVGRADATEAILRAILRRDRRNGWATRKLALVLAAKKGNRAAWDEALALIGPEARPDDVPEDVYTRAGVYAEGPGPAEHARAVALLKGLVAELPNMAVAQDRLARLLEAAGDLPGARDHAARAAGVDQPNADSVLLYAGLLIALKDLPGAEAQLSRLAALEPDSLPVAEVRARILAARGQKTQAAEELERAFNARAEGPEALFVGEKMVPLLNTLDPEAAERVARRLAKLGPRGACVLAGFLADRGKTDEALALYREAGKGDEAETAGTNALTLGLRPGADPRWLAVADELLAAAVKRTAPGSIDLLQKQALVRHFQHRHEDEIALYHTILDRKPANFLFLNNLAWTLCEEVGKPAEGLNWADEAVKRVGPTPALLDTRGVILTRLNRYDEAVRDLESAAGQRPDGTVFFHLARAYVKKGDEAGARRARDRAKSAGLAREQLARSEQADWEAVMNP